MLPLEGIKVIEVAMNLAGPYCSQILAHLGAEVIKVERPGHGDDARGWGRELSGGAGSSFNAVNLGKKGIVVDLKDEAEVERLRCLIDQADVLVQNLRPGTLDALGLGAEALMKRNPRLVYCSVNAYGDAGPLRLDPGYEPIVQAFAGMMMMSGLPDGPPVRMGTQVLDHGSAMWAAIGVLAALNERQRTGRGRRVDGSLFETAIGWWTNPYASYAASGEVPTRHPTGSTGVVVFEGFQASDGPLVIAAGSDSLFRTLARALGRPDWATAKEYATNRDRVARRLEIIAEVQKIVAGKSRAEWIETLRAAGVPCAPINTLPEMLAEPQTAATGLLQDVPGLERDVKLIGLPLRFDGERPPIRYRAPKHGEHTDEILGKRGK
jgi:crotonobetainyl-CoA:carnitine CoA-transferase CaiB-like acyl-CoA transferase